MESQQNNSKTDQQFPDQFSSLGVFETIKELREDKIIWKPLNEYFQNPVLFVDINSKLQSNQVKETSFFLNSTFINSVKLLIDKSDTFIKKLFPNQDNLDPFQVNLYQDGQLKIITVDSYLPVNKDLNQPVTSQLQNKQEIWLTILEKAWAKICGSYYNGTQKHILQCLSSLTGTPYEFINHDYVTADQVWEKLYFHSQHNNILFGSSGSEQNEQERHQGRIIQVLEAVEVPHQTGKVKLVRLKDMNNKIEWTGDWSSKSTLWTPQLKIHLNLLEVEAKGQFFMSFEDYLCYFNSTSIQKIHFKKANPFVRQQVEMGGFNALEFKVQKQMEILYVIFYLERQREESDLSVIVSVKRDEKYQWIKSTSSKQDIIQLELQHLEGGEYLIYSDQTRIKQLHFYSQESIEVIDTLKDNQNLILNNLLKDHARNNEKKYFYEGQKNKGIYRVIDLMQDQKVNFGYVYFCNNSKDEECLRDKIIFKELKGFQLEDLNSDQLEVLLEPGQDKLFILKNLQADISYKLMSYNKVFIHQSRSEQGVKDKGKKQQLIDEGKGKNYNAYVYMLQHENGFSILFDNQEENLTFMLRGNFEIQNLKSASNDPKPEDINFKLKAKESVLKEFEIIDHTQKTSLKYKYNFKIHDDYEYSEDEMKQKCLKEGKREQLSSLEEQLKVSYYTIEVNDKQFWLFVSEEDSKIFEGSYRMQLKNLEDEFGKEEVDWKIILKPRESVLKKLFIQDIYQNCSVGLSASYSLK